MSEENLPNLHIRRAKKSTELEKGDDLPTLIFQRKRKRFKEKPEQRTKAMDSTIECLDCGTINPLIINSYGKFGEVYCAGCGGLLISYKSQTEEEVFEEDDTELEDSRPIVSRGQPSFSAPSVPKDQAPDRYQPAQGQSRLGRDIQTGRYVDVPQASRRQGLYIIGATGTGKSGLIENLIVQDIKQGVGVCVLDPHGDLINAVLARMDRRVDDVILLDITDYHYPFGINLFSCSDPTNPLKVSEIVEQVRHIFEKLLGVTQETQLILEYLYNCTSTLIANPGYTMADIPLLLQDGECRRKLVANVTDSDVQLFWRHHDQKKPADQNNDIASILRRVRQLLQPLSRPIVGQSTSTIDMQRIMNEGKILLVKLSAQYQSISNLIGSILIALILNAAYSRPANKRRQFNLYADEFQRFATEDFATLLTEARKFGIATTIAHQARYQPGMTDGIRATTLGAANLVVFRVQPEDATELAGRFDITPQEAWEEELEPERIKVLRPQRHERIEEQVEVEVEEDVMEISHTPFDYLIRNSHKNVKVREAAHALDHFSPSWYPVIYKDEEMRDYLYGLVGGLFINVVFSEKTDLNSLLIDVMEGRLPPRTKALADRIEKHVLCYAPRIGWLGQNQFTVMNYTYEGYSSWEEYDRYRVQQQIGRLSRENYEKYVGRLQREAEGQPEVYKCFSALIWGLVSGQSQIDRLKQDLADMLLDLFVRVNAEKKYYRNHFRDMSSPVFDQKDSGYRNDEKLQAKVLTRCEEEVRNARRRIQEWTPSAVDGLVSYVSHVVTLCEVLATEEGKIKVHTGQKRMVKRIQPHITYLTDESEKITIPRKTIMHPQRTYADVLNEVASQIANLPVYTAKVKIAVGEQAVEHMIRTLDPKQEPGKPLLGPALEERKDRIKAQNIQDGYLRKQAEVLAEITKRQKQCSEHPEPPEEPPDAIYRRPPR